MIKLYKENQVYLKKILNTIYCKDLCYEKQRHLWTNENKTFGMCAITSLILNDHYGGDIAKIRINNVSHYFNIIDNEIIDFTAEQFNVKIDYSNYIVIERNSLLVDDTITRYTKLKDNLSSYEI